MWIRMLKMMPQVHSKMKWTNHLKENLRSFAL
jgi:hypothetical protein